MFVIQMSGQQPTSPGPRNTMPLMTTTTARVKLESSVCLHPLLMQIGEQVPHQLGGRIKVNEHFEWGKNAINE
jgi:hypothetical protein